MLVAALTISALTTAPAPAAAAPQSNPPRPRHPRFLLHDPGANGEGAAFSIAGGVKVDTIGAVRDAGADVAVAGGAIYGADDPAAAKALRDALAPRSRAPSTGP